MWQKVFGRPLGKSFGRPRPRSVFMRQAGIHRASALNQPPDGIAEFLIGSPSLSVQSAEAGDSLDEHASSKHDEIADVSAELRRIEPTLTPWVGAESHQLLSEKDTWKVAATVWTLIIIFGGVAVATIISVIR